MAGRATNEPSNYFAIGRQAAHGQDADTFRFLRHLEGTGMELEETTESVREGGDGQEVGFVHRTAINMDGNAVSNVRPDIGAALYVYTLGGYTVTDGTGAASGAVQIISAAPTSQAPYLTVEQYWADVIERVGNAQINSLSLEGEAGRPLKLTAGFLGGGTPWSRPAASALTPTRETGQPFFYPGGQYELTGASGAKMTKFKHDINRNLDGDIRTTQLFREDVVALNFDSALEGTLKYEDRDLYERVHYLGDGTIDPNALGLATGAFSAFSEFGAGGDHRFFRVDLPLIVYTGARVNKLDPDGKTMYIDFSAMGVKGATHQVIPQFSVASGAEF